MLKKTPVRCKITTTQLSIIVLNQRSVQGFSGTCNRFLGDASFSIVKDIADKHNGQSK